jgi:pimeloyl-ACP methyl ester carboxylesterase
MPDSKTASPTVVLVHGAFADAGSWADVTEILLAAGVNVQAPANPLRGIATDSAYVASVLSQITGPVLAVGHSYGGAVITNAATQASNVVGLVYVAAFAPDENETLGEVEGTSRDSVLAPALLPAQFPGADGAQATELYVNPEQFHEVFAHDLPEADAGVLGASQRPVAAAAFEEKSGAPAWKTLPSWAVVATGDKAAGADVILSMAKRAGAQITELEGSHVIMISQPRAVADVILAALKAVG